MRKVFTNGWKITLLVWLVISEGYSQIRIGPSSGTIVSSASLQVISGPYSLGSPYRGLLPPIVTTSLRSQIQSPATGLLIYNSSTNQIEVNTGSPSVPIWTAGGAANGAGNSWNLSGNAGTTSGNFLGTSDNTPLYFRVNNQNSGRIDQLQNNVALGYLAFSSGATGTGNTALGTLALASSTSGNYNTALGLQALTSNTSGTGNTALGTVALLSNTTGQNNTASGYRSLYSNTTGQGNTALGSVALMTNSSGNNNTALGTVALTSNTTGANNTASGAGALQKNTTGYENTAVGSNASATNTTGYSNIAVGTDALYNNLDGHDNTAFGGSALLNNTSGPGNMASGNLALRLNTTGANNTASGTIALQNNTTGSYNTALGYNSGPSTGNLNNATAIGANAIVNASNQIVLGDNSISSLRCNVQTISTLSDKRIKEDIRANVPGLNFITKLNPVTYHINKLKEAKLLSYSVSNIKDDTVLHSGFLAQDVEAAAKEVGYDFEGVRQEEGGRYYTLGYTLFVMPLVQAVKDLNAEVEKLKDKVLANEMAYKQLADQVKRMQNLIGVSQEEKSAKNGGNNKIPH
ncbi:tail fiber domain-containing protein [Spirosoma litoris]